MFKNQINLPINKLLVIFLLIICITSFLACSKKSTGKFIISGEKVLVLGDSISAGYGVGVGKSWVSVLQNISSWQIINAGVSGDTTSGGLARLPRLIAKNKPKAVIIELGGNDMLRRMDRRQMIANLEKMINIAKEANLQVILVAIPEVSLFSVAISSLSDAKFYQEIANNNDIVLVDEVVSDVLSQKNLRLDNIHPNIDGHKILGERIVAKLRNLHVL